MYTAPNQGGYQDASINVQDILVMESYLVSAYSLVSYDAYKSTMLGMIDELGYSFEGALHSQLIEWVTMNCQIMGSNIFWYGMLESPDMGNPIFSNSIFDSELEDQMFTTPIATNPYNTMVKGSAITNTPLGGDQPWMAYSWKTSLIPALDGSGGQWTNVTLYFRHDITWHDGVPFTVDDVNYTIYENAIYGDSWAHASFMFLVDPTTYAPYFTKWDNWTCSILARSPSWLSLYQCNFEILPMHIYKYIVPNDLTLAEQGLSTDGLHGLWPGQAAMPGNLLAGAPFTLSQLTTVGGEAITWVGTGPWKYKVGTFAGFGPGYSIMFDAHQAFFLKIAPGAIAFKYTWLNSNPSGQPSGGSYKTGLSDLVYLANAYGTRGTPPIPFNIPGTLHVWNPGCDLAMPSCSIGLPDLVTLALHYGWYYGNYSYNAPYPPSEAINGGP